jgi:cysteine desulfurase
MTYLDANATEPLRPCARAAALAAMDLPGNPSSVHQAGREARHVLEQARQAIAGFFGSDRENLVFTSGGTEANGLAIVGLGAGRTIVCGATEHAAVLAAAPGAEIVPVDRSGRIDPCRLDATLQATGPALVCIMLANNETGVIAPMRDIAAVCARRGALLHADAVQAARRMAVNMQELGVTSLAISGHKLGAPKGAGALLMAAGHDVCAAVIQGGGQERGRRGGTPALPAIAGMSAALLAAEPNTSTLEALRDRAESAAVAAGAIVCGAGPRLANTTCLALPGARADAQVIALDLAGVAVSAGAACSSGKVARSHVLDAMGLSDLAGCAIRVSLPWNVTEADIDVFVSAYTGIAARMRHRARAA